MLTTGAAPEAAPAQRGASSVASRRDQVWHRVAAGMVLVLGVLQALWYRGTLNPDGVAYLDLSDEILSGRWRAVVQGYWSPLYPALLAIARAVGGRGPAHETMIAHLVNLGGLTFALFRWHRLVAQLARRQSALIALHTPLGMAGAYAVFAWAMLWLLSLHFVTPDAWLAGWVFWASALVLAHGDREREPPSFALGAVLGAGYLTKAVLLPVSPFVIAGAVWLTPRPARRRAALRAVSALVLLSAPWIAAISVRERRPTFGDNGRFNYGWFVSADRWLSPDPARETGAGSAVFPRVNDSPAVYAWPDRVGTYAPWRDPSSFHAGMKPAATPEQQARVFSRSTRLLWFWMAPWCVALIALLATGVPITRDAVRPLVAIALPCVVALGGYAAVFVEGRYVAPFVAVIVLAAFSSLGEAMLTRTRIGLGVLLGASLWFLMTVRIPNPSELLVGIGLTLSLIALRRGTSTTLSRVACGILITFGGVHVLSRSATETRGLIAGEQARDAARPMRNALALAWSDAQPRIGVISDGPSAAIWARQLRARIVAEVPASEAPRYWAAPDSVQRLVVQRMREAGAREIIATVALPDTLPSGWRRLSGATAARYVLDVP